MAQKIQIHDYIHGSCLGHYVIISLESIWWENVDQIICRNLDSERTKNYLC
jgi:hypothetical protein